MRYCQFDPRDDGTFVCRHCGRAHHSAHAADALHLLCRDGRQWAGKTRSTLIGRTRMVRGPGDFLHDIIKSRLGQEAIAGCGCSSVWAEMNELGVEGCRREINRLAARLVEIATQKEWLIQEERGQDVAAGDIGKPVPQTWRTRTARGFARIAAKLPAGMTLIEWQCRRLVLLAIRRAEWDEWKRHDLRRS